MAEFYTNLPPKDKDNFDKTVEKLTTGAYQEEYQLEYAPKSLRSVTHKLVLSRHPLPLDSYTELFDVKVANLNSLNLLDRKKYSGV